MCSGNYPLSHRFSSVGNKNLTFTTTIYKESDPDKYVNQSITVTTHYSELQTVIQGGNELTIGRDAGNVTIDGAASFDPDNVAMDMSYEWLCEQVSHDHEHSLRMLIRFRFVVRFSICM